MSNSILISTKHNLGLEPDYTVFDQGIITYINSALATLGQLGIGPEDGFDISDDTALWSDFFGADKLLNLVQTYVYLKVRLTFDPPTSSYGLAALERQIEEFGFRINTYRESYGWVDPRPPVIVIEE